MKVIKTGGGGPIDLPDTVSGANGQEEIVEKFKSIYSELYNSAGTQVEMTAIRESIKKLIRPESVQEVSKVTGCVVKQAMTDMKPSKSDVSGCFNECSRHFV